MHELYDTGIYVRIFIAVDVIGLMTKNLLKDNIEVVVHSVAPVGLLLPSNDFLCVSMYIHVYRLVRWL